MNINNEYSIDAYVPENETISQEFQIISLEKRMENTEKFLVFFEELLKLKKEERLAEQIINNSTINEIEKKFIICEEDFKNLVKKKNCFLEESMKKLEIFENKLKSVIEERNDEMSKYYASSIGEMESLIKKNEFIVETYFQTKMLYFYQILDSKFEDILNILEDISKKTESTEIEYNKSKRLIQMIQQDHLDFFNILNILKENSSKLELSLKQISEIKFKFNKILKILLGEEYVDEQDENNYIK